MKGHGKSMLVISHDAVRAGAPILLLTLLAWFKEQGFTIHLLLLRGGELQGEFEKTGPVFQLEKKPFLRGPLGRKLNNWLIRQQLKRFIQKSDADLVYANTAVSAAYWGRVEPQLRTGLPVVCHLHELEISIAEFAGRDAFRKALPLVTRFICVSEAVKKNLLQNYTVAPSAIDVVPEPIALPVVHRSVTDTRKELGLTDNDFIVIGAGTTDWRKAPDLFLQTAALVNKKAKVHFIWVGAVNELTLLKFTHDIHRLGLEQTVSFIGKKTHIADYFAAADVFYLPSREDPYPLVCLEAAALGKPVICFDQGGGMPEFVQQDAGFSVPYMDLAQAAERILLLRSDPDQVKARGAAAMERVVATSLVTVVAPRILSVLTTTLLQTSVSSTL